MTELAGWSNYWKTKHQHGWKKYADITLWIVFLPIAILFSMLDDIFDPKVV